MARAAPAAKDIPPFTTVPFLSVWNTTRITSPERASPPIDALLESERLHTGPDV
jgi:hypothetical protein